MVGGDIKLEETAKTNLRASGRCLKIMHVADELISSRQRLTDCNEEIFFLVVLVQLWVERGWHGGCVRDV